MNDNVADDTSSDAHQLLDNQDFNAGSYEKTFDIMDDMTNTIGDENNNWNADFNPFNPNQQSPFGDTFYEESWNLNPI